jgi:hypothetical protein
MKLVTLVLTRWCDTGWNAEQEKIYHLICTIHHRIYVDNLTKFFSATQIFLLVVPKRCSPQKSAYWYRLITALRSRKKNICHRQICERTDQFAEQM